MILNFDLVLLFTLGNLCFAECMSLLSFWRDRDIRKALHLCPQRWELMGAIRAGGPLRTLVQPDQTIVLQCRFCEDPEKTEDDDDIGMWTFVDIVHGSAPVRLPRLVGDDTATKRSFFGLGQKPRIVITESQSLALRKLRTIDLGLYQCRRDSDNSSIGSTVRFLIDMDIALFEGQLKREKGNNFDEKDEEDEDSEENEHTTENTSTVKDEEIGLMDEIPLKNGTFADWVAYRADSLDSLDKVISKSNLHLEAISEWSPWAECRDCETTKHGIRVRRGVCVVRLPLHETENEDVIAKELAGLPALACKSAVLSHLHPEVGAAARKVPDFLEFDYQGCNGVCGKNSSQSHGSLLHRLVYLFRHRRDTPITTHKKITINVGEALVIVCPDATAETPVHWEKDGEAIGGGTVKTPIHKRNPVQGILTKMRQMERWVSGEVAGIKITPENTPFVDLAGVFHVKSATPRDSGSYECSVSGTPRGTFLVEVIVKSALSIDDIMRHFAYVSLVLLSCIMIWCGVVICVSLRGRFKKNKYSPLPARQSPPPGLNTSGGQPDTPQSYGGNESMPDKAESGGKRNTKHVSIPSRKSPRVAQHTDRPGSPSHPTASYHNLPSRLRIRHLSRLMSRNNSNNDIELVRLLPPKSSMHFTNYRSEQSGTIRRSHRQQYSSASFSSADHVEVETTADRPPVVVLSQQLFPASQKALRPPPLSSVSLTNQCQFRPHRNSIEPVPNRTELSMQQRARLVSRSPCLWVPSAISTSVLRARNSLRQGKPANPSSNTSKPNKSVRMGEMPLQMHHSSERAETPKDPNARTGTNKKRRKKYKRSNSSKPRKSRSQTSKLSHGKTSKRLKKRRGPPPSPTSSQTKSPVRRKPINIQTKNSSPRQISLIKSSVSRLNASPIHFSKQNSPLHSRCVCSPGKTSPRLSLLYKALPSPKPTASSSNSRDPVSSISLLSNSAGNCAVDTQDVVIGRENSAEPIKASPVIHSNTVEGETNDVPTPDDQINLFQESSLKKLSLSPQPVVSKASLTRPTRSIQSITAHPKSRSDLPPSSMFEIKKAPVAETQTITCLLDIPSPTGLSRQPSMVLRGFPTTQLEQSDSLEKLNLVAAFLETPAQGKSLSSTKSQTQSSECLSATRSQVQLLNPKSPSQGSFLVPPSVVIASPRQSEMSLSTATPPVRSSTSSCTKCNVAHGESAPSTLPVPVRPQMHQKSSKILTAISRRKSPIQSKSCVQANASTKSTTQTQRTTEVSRQLLPALLSPCAIAMSDHAPVLNKLIRTGPPLPPKESPPQLKKLKPVPGAGAQRPSMSSIRSSTSTQSTFNPFTKHQEISGSFEKNAKRSISPSNTESTSRLRFAVEETLEDVCANVERVPPSDTSVRAKSPVKDLAIQLSAGKIAVPGYGSPKMYQSEVGLVQERNKCTGSRPDLFTAYRATRCDDVPMGRFRRTETETRGSSHSDWVSAHYKTTKKTTSSEMLQCHDNSKEAVSATALRKISSNRFFRHKGYFVRQKPVPEVDRLEVIVVDFDKLNQENTERREALKTEQNENIQREAATSRSKERSKSHSIFESVTKSITPAAAIAFPQIISTNVPSPVNLVSSVSQPTQNQIISTNVLSPVNLVSSVSQPTQNQIISTTVLSPVNLVSSVSQPTQNQIISTNVLSPVNLPSSVSQLTQTQSQQESLIRSESQLSESSYQQEVETFQESNPASLPTSFHIAGEFTKSSESSGSKPSISKVRNRSKRNSYATLPTVTGPLQSKFKQKVKYLNIGASYHSEFPHSNFNFVQPMAQSPSGSSKFIHAVNPHSVQLKLETRSMPQASISPSFAKLIGTPHGVSKSLGEVKAKQPMKSHTSKPPPSPTTFLHPRSSYSPDSHYAVQLLAREPSPVSSHTTQVEKGDILNTCDAQVQSAMLLQPEHGIQRSHNGLKDESTSFGSLCEPTAKSRRVRLATTEMASQVSNIRTTINEAQTLHPFITHLASKRQQFTPKPSRPSSTRVRSKSTATPGIQRTEVQQTNLKSRLMKSPQDHVTRLPPSCTRYPEQPMIKHPQCLAAARLGPPARLQSRLPMAVKKIGQRRKPVESRLNPPKSPDHPKQTQPRTRVRRPPAAATASRPPVYAGRATGMGSCRSPRIRSPAPHRSPQRVYQESSTLSVGFSRHRLSPISSRPVKSGLLRTAEEQMFEKVTKSKDIERTDFQDYDSHHNVSESQITVNDCNQMKRDKERISSQLDISTEAIKQAELLRSAPSHTAALLDPTKPPFSGMLVTDKLRPAVSGAFANAAQGIIAISMTRNSTSTPTVPNQPEAEFRSGDVIEEPLATSTKDETNNQTFIRRQGRSSSQTSFRRKLRNQKPKRTFVPHALKIGPTASVRRNSPSRPQSQTPGSGVFVFGAQERQQTRQDLLLSPNISTFLTEVRNFKNDNPRVLNSSTCPDFLEDGCTSVWPISTIEYEREKTKHGEQSDP